MKGQPDPSRRRRPKAVPAGGASLARPLRAEVSDVGFEEAQAVLACLAGLAGRRPKAAAAALAELVHRRVLARASEVLIRWATVYVALAENWKRLDPRDHKTPGVRVCV